MTAQSRRCSAEQPPPLHATHHPPAARVHPRQVCVWKLGAPTAAMFFGLRLVFAVCLSTPILGSTVIQTGVQIAGVVVTAVAVTCYAGSQWWASRQAQRRAAAAAAAAEGAGAGGA